jgi:HupE / UreJ protein
MSGAVAAAAAAFAWMASAGSALAHTRSESHSSWQISGPDVHLQFTVPDLEAKRLPAAQGAEDTALLAYLAAHLEVDAQGAPCAPSAAPRALAAAAGYRRFEFQYRCAGETGIRLTDTAFFDLVATHTNFAQIRGSEGELTEQLFTREHPTLDLGESGGAERLENAGFVDYLAMGVQHIFTGVDHQAFLLGLVLLSRRLRDLVFVVTGFTLGHSLTLALAVTGVIRPHAEFIDALVGLTIVLIGMENIVAYTHRPLPAALGLGGLLALMAIGRWLGYGGLPVLVLIGAGLFAANYLMVSGRLRDAGRLRVAVTLVFGLIHGFGFASNLLEMRLPADPLAELLLGFNLGVEIGQLSCVALVLTIAFLFTRWASGLPRRAVTEVVASCLVAVGMFWFVSRSYV